LEEKYMATDTTYQLSQPPTMKTQMLIRKPAGAVFEAFVDPAITTKFWFTKSSGRLEPGAEIRWEWEIYNVSATVRVKEIERNSRIVIEWGDEENGFTIVEWRFKPWKDETTFVTITEKGYRGDGDQMVARAIDSMGGFSFVLAAAKALLEHEIVLTLTADHAPDGVQEQ
jgi:uncharacterized protein YndB with AHSA1/START domain